MSNIVFAQLEAYMLKQNQGNNNGDITNHLFITNALWGIAEREKMLD